jgi:hypothetical protein
MKSETIRLGISGVITLCLILSGACSKDDAGSKAEIISYKLTGQQEVELDRSAHSVDIILPGTVLTAGNMTADFELSEGATATINGVAQISKVTSNNFNQPLIYKVRSEDMSKTVEWTVSTTNNNYTLDWGLGQFLTVGKSNNKSYEWYLDQFNTGTHKLVNCGPTSTTMAAKWSNQAFIKTPEDARAAYRPEGGWWYTNDINNYLSNNSISHYTVALGGAASATSQILTGNIDAGKIVILCLDMFFVRQGTEPELRTDKFYNTTNTGWGHFIVVKGYRTVDGKLFFEVYDPYCNSAKYADQTMKGKNRFYRSEDIFNATSIWWNYAIVVSPAGSKGTETGLDPSTIPQAWGR